MTTQTSQSTYTIDPVHSTAEFSVKHMMISTVKGSFRDLDGLISIDEEDPRRSRVEATIKTASVDTGLRCVTTTCVPPISSTSSTSPP